MFMLMKLSGSSDDQIDGQMGSGFLAFSRKLRILVCRTQSLYAATLHVHDNIYIRYKLCRDGRWLFFFFAYCWSDDIVVVLTWRENYDSIKIIIIEWINCGFINVLNVVMQVGNTQ